MDKKNEKLFTCFLFTLPLVLIYYSRLIVYTYFLPDFEVFSALL